MDIGLAVGGAFLSSVLQVLFDRLAPQGELLKMFQRDKRDVRLLKKLRMTLLGLQAVLSDAQKKQASNQSVSQWLNELQDAVDGAENLIEEVNYEVLRLKVEGQHQYLSEASNQQVSDEFFDNIKEKLEDTIELLEELEKQIGHLGLIKNYLDSGKQETRTPSTSVVDESDIFGRQNEIKELVGRLLSSDANGETLTVIPIVGMAGIGKTTLAKAVYNNETVKKHFDLKAWFCVSEPYDALRITKGLLQEIDSFDTKADNNLNQLQIKLKESLKGKKFLIVLDDVWNENYNAWADLRYLFIQGDVGSKIIVTTRKGSVASTMGNEKISMDMLSSEESWSLFKRHAFGKMEPKKYQELEKVGKEIADKCKGLPLALKTLAGMLRSKSDVEGWRRILRSETWELPDNDILPALMLSYSDLPSHLKRCFAYLAIFPKDYPFCKERVIQLWIANGLVQQLQQDETIADSSNQFFLELRSRSLIERVPGSTQRNTEIYLMHDLVNDLARIASSQLCITLEENAGFHNLERTRHLSYSVGYGEFEKLKPLNKLEQLRTLLPVRTGQYSRKNLSKRVLHNILPTLTTLRALSLSGYEIKELPNVLFINLRLLRFLDLSWTEIKKLPDSICVLYNLETLLLSSCRLLEELPLQMEKLINLRHLDLRGTSPLKMQLHPSKLKNLHVLVGARFPIGCWSSLKIEDLGELHNLYGDLKILELQNVADRREALKANMREKKNVEKLLLEWSESIADNSQDERDILDALQPNTNLKELQITGYRGTKFPNWLADHSFLELVELRLSYCKDCDSLPALGQLPSLKSLTIIGMDRIIEVTEEFYGSPSSIKPFKSLERLEFERMEEWKQWDVLGIGEFPTLQCLTIEDCPKLTGKLPKNLCSLTRLRISRCPELILETLIQLSSLKKFEVVGSPRVGVLFDHAELFTTQLQGMKQIEELHIEKCRSLTSLPISCLPNTLKVIEISKCGKLKLEPSISETISDMFLDRLTVNKCDSIDEILPELVPRARYLGVWSCPSITRLLIPTGTEDLEIYRCENLEIFLVACDTQMTSLRIRECKKLKSLPERLSELLLSLKCLILLNCPEIESFPEGGLPFNLETLEIRKCKKLVNGRKEWHLQGLTKLIICHDGSDEEIDWELPASIQSLTISNMKTLSSQVLKSLRSLETLWIDKLPQIESLLQEGLPTSLSEISLSNHDELHSLPTVALRRLTSLRILYIRSCKQLKSLPESALRSSLTELAISDCPNLKSLPALPSSLSELAVGSCDNLKSLPALPSSLSELTISDCDNLKSLSALPSSLSELTIKDCLNLQSLPVNGMPSSLKRLSIDDCPLLKQRLEFDKGKYWPKIAHIPTIEIDEEYL